MENGNVDTMILSEILHLTGSFCGSTELDQQMAVAAKASEREKNMLGGIDEVDAATTAFSAPSFEESLEQVITFCSRKLGPHDYQSVLLGIGDIFKSHGRLANAEHFFNLVVEYAHRCAFNDYVAEALVRRAKVYALQGLWRKSQQDLDESRELFVREHNEIAVARIDNVVGANLAEQGEILKAQKAFLRALERFEVSRHPLETGMVLMNLGITQNILGNFVQALDYYHRVIPYFQEAGDMNRLAELRHNIAMTYRSQGKCSEAIQEFNESLSYSRRIQDPSLMSLALFGKAEAFFTMGDSQLSLVFANQAQEYFGTVGDRGGIAEVYKLKGMIFRDRKEYDIAASHFQTSLRINDEIHNIQNTAETQFEMGKMEQQREHLKAARGHFDAAMNGFQKLGASELIAQVAAEIAGLGKH